MPDLDLVPVLVATAAAFVASGAYYAVLGDQLVGATLHDTVPDSGPPHLDPTPPWALGVEVGRSLVVATVTAGLVVEMGLDDWIGGAILGLALWIGFPIVLWVGAITHERTPWNVAAVHAGDWLLKLLIVATLAAAWP